MPTPPHSSFAPLPTYPHSLTHTPTPGPQIHARRYRLGADVDLRQLARDLPGFSGADLANVLNEAALSAVRRGGDEVCQADVDQGVDRMIQARANGLRLAASPRPACCLLPPEQRCATL